MTDHSRYAETLKGDYSVRHKITFSDEKRLPHIHTEFELLLVHSKGMHAVINERRYELKPDTLLLFNDMDLHHIRMRRGGANDRHVLYFKPEYIQALSTKNTNLLECFLFRPFADANLLPLTAENARRLSAAMDELAFWENQENKPYGYDLKVKLLLAELLLEVNRLYRACHGMGEGAGTGRYELVYSIICFLHAHYQEDLSLDDLAQRFYVNKYSLCSLFRETTGTTPNQYLIHCRLLKAKELLINGLPVENVCAEAGYNNLSHFSRAFKQHVGVSPKQFQQRALHGDGRK